MRHRVSGPVHPAGSDAGQPAGSQKPQTRDEVWVESGGEGLVSPRRTLWKMPPPPTCSRGRVTALARGPASRPRGRGLPPSSPHVRPCFVPLADEGLWDVFVKDIPRSATSCTVSLDRLRPGVTYEFRVLAVNQVGYGEPSSPSTAVSGRGPPGKLLIAGAGGRGVACRHHGTGGDGAVLAAASPGGLCAPWEQRLTMSQPRAVGVAA